MKTPSTNEILQKKYITSTFIGSNFVASTAQITNSTIENCEIGENVQIYNTNLKDCKIENNSKIGTHKKQTYFPPTPEPQIPKPKSFGTDGIRGIFGQDLTEDLIKKVAKSLCFGKKPKIVLGTDTRPSGQQIAKIFTETATSYGAKILNLGIISTPAVAFFTLSEKADFGVIITASHNPKEYNGIKVIGKNGQKLTETEEIALENLFEKPLEKTEIGKVKKLKADKYITFLQNLDTNKFDGIKIVLDCANGAVSAYAPKLFDDLHAEVIPLNIDGEINEKCGALFPEVLAKNVQKFRADIGFSFDGDADRLIAVNSKGQILNGDEILYLLAWYYKNLNALQKNNIVGTILTNTGIENKIKALGLNLIRTQVGDKYIAEVMEKQNLELGGEQAGHIINKKYLMSGDGLLNARILTSIFLENKHIFFSVKDNKYVQVYKNINLNNKINKSFFNSAEYNSLINFYQSKLKNGKIIIRPSGTEPKIRIMVETTDKTTANIFAIDIKKKLNNLINLYFNSTEKYI